MSRREWGEFLVDDTPMQNSKNPVASGGVYSAIETVDAKVQRGLNTTQTNSYGYSLVGTLNVTDLQHRGMMAFELFCCKWCSRPIRMNATFGYYSDNDLRASYSIESSVDTELARYKLAWRFADDHTPDTPKIEIWLIDTIYYGTDTRRCGCVVHMVSGIEWVNGSKTTVTLPSGLTYFAPFFTQFDKILPANIFNAYGPSTEQLTNSDVSNGYKDFTNVLYYGRYPNFQNFTFKTCDALVVVTLNDFSGVIGGTSVPVTEFTFEVYAGNESNPTEIFIRSVTKTDLTDTDDRGVAIQDLPSGVEPVWNCTLLGSPLAVVCDRITVRVKWKNPGFGMPGNRLKGFFSVAVINPSGMTEWPQDE